MFCTEQRCNSYGKVRHVLFSSDQQESYIVYTRLSKFFATCIFRSAVVTIACVYEIDIYVKPVRDIVPFGEDVSSTVAES